MIRNSRAARARLQTVMVLLLAASMANAALPGDAPPLPAPDPGTYDIVTVDTAQELADACWNLTSNQAIIVAAGTYDLTSVSPPNGVDGRLTVGHWGAAPISNIQIRGATGNPADVVITGGGMADSWVPFGFQIFTASNVLIADLSMGEVYNHAVAIQNDQGATNVHLYHNRLFNAGQQIVKASDDVAPGAANVVIEYCEVFYTAGVPNHAGLGYCYTNGIDAIAGQNWIIRDNLIRNIYCQDGSLAGPAVLMWQGSSGTVVERNTFLNCCRGVSLGLTSASDHSGGIVRNNFLRWDPSATYTRDVAIYTASSGSKVLHNTVLSHRTYHPNDYVALEVRFADNVLVKANLMDAEIWEREGVTNLSLVDNFTTAPASWFVNEASGDLHLRPEATAAIDQVSRDADCSDDFDAATRPAAANQVDLGADEYSPLIFADGFESGNTSAWSTRVP